MPLPSLSFLIGGKMAKSDMASNEVLKVNDNLSIELKLRLCGQFKLEELHGVEGIEKVPFKTIHDQVKLLAVLSWQLDQKSNFDDHIVKVQQLDMSDMLNTVEKALEQINAKLKNQSGVKKKAPKRKKEK